MSAEQSEERHWRDNHPWLGYRNTVTDDDGDLRLRGQKIEIRWVWQMESYQVPEDSGLYFFGLAYDRAGNFYGVSEVSDGPRGSMVKKLTGKSALVWFAEHASWDEAFTRELMRVINNPAFEFMPLVPTRELPKRKRKARKQAEAFHKQLHMATALVECVKKLEAEPSLENLSEACRSASQLHTAIHAPENFKLASNG
jgi:hypothetical protein